MNPITPVIPATIGRRVLVFAATLGSGKNTPVVNQAGVPFDGGIAYVHGDAYQDGEQRATMINVGFMDHNGAAHSMTSVKLLDRAQADGDQHGKEWYAVWMPFQFQQAQRHAAQGASKPADIELVKLADNDVLTEAGLAKVQAELREQDQAERGVA